ncbi:MAG: HAMP domain-containing histidine kinase [Isosphaeraceae bacterium]|nr:HAMP domain-containing histidine kinase [Isosphaeraceae bacterium]
MDARSDLPHLPQPVATRSVVEQAELRALLSHLSHELCRPLIALRAGFDLLLGDTTSPVSPEQRGHLLTMVGLCDGLLALTRSYLDFAGLVQGSRPLHYGSYTLRALIGEIDRQFAPEAAARRIAWECRLDGSDATVTTDAERCQQVFGNLVSNALKYTPEGGRVRLVARREGPHWVVVISDTGPGIPPEARALVFEPFYRLPREERSGIEGNGLGLTICRELVQQMGGEIAISPKAGPGVQITVRLPVQGPGGRSSH